MSRRKKPIRIATAPGPAVVDLNRARSNSAALVFWDSLEMELGLGLALGFLLGLCHGLLGFTVCGILGHTRF